MVDLLNILILYQEREIKQTISWGLNFLSGRNKLTHIWI